jgi:hypothetical protein
MKHERTRLKISPVPITTNATHPDVPNPEVLPQHEFTLGLISPKGSGKTTLIVNLLEFYKSYFETIILFSPTLYSDDKWDYVKKQPLLGENKRLEKWFEKQRKKHEKMDDARVVVVKPGKPGWSVTGQTNSTKKKKVFDPKIPKEMMMSEYDETTLQKVIDEQDMLIEKLSNEGGTKHLANRILLIFDDLVGSNLFSGARDNPFKKLNTTHRHWSMSLIMVSQAYREIPKTVRTQFSALILFEIPNQKEIEVIYEENPVGLKRQIWQKVYEAAVEGPYNFMFINYQRPRDLRIMKNFDRVMFIKRDNVDSSEIEEPPNKKQKI